MGKNISRVGYRSSIYAAIITQEQYVRLCALDVGCNI